MALDNLLSDPSWLIKVAIRSGLADDLRTPKTLQNLVELGYDQRIVESVLFVLQKTTPPTVTQSTHHYQWEKQPISHQDLFDFEMERRKMHLIHTLKTGQPAGKMEPWIYEILSKDMITTASSIVKPVISFVKKHIPADSVGIDVGGAHGMFAKELVEHHYKMTILDLPIAKQQAIKTAPSIPFISHNILQKPLETEIHYDWALLVRFIRMHSIEGISQSIKHLSYALKDLSRLIIIDTFRDDSQQADAVTMKMMLNTPNGNTYHKDQLKSILPDWTMTKSTMLTDYYTATVWERQKQTING